MVARLYIGDTKPSLREELNKAFSYIGLIKELSSPKKVFIKPNFTFPRPKPGVTTTAEMLITVAGLLSDYGAEVFIGESNGGYGSFTAEEAFTGHALLEICRRTRSQPLDLSTLETREYSGHIGGRIVTITLPKMLVEDVDFTVSVPVLKVHAMTTVSLSVKNLWGCYPTDFRLLEHADIDRKLTFIKERIRARFGVVDAIYGLDRHGPMEGTPRNLGKFIAGNDLVSLDSTCAKMMGFDARKILHLRNVRAFSPPLDRTGGIDSNVNPEHFNWGFSLQRDLIDTLSFLCFHSDHLARVVFNSPFTRPIYAALGRQPRRKIV